MTRTIEITWVCNSSSASAMRTWPLNSGCLKHVTRDLNPHFQTDSDPCVSRLAPKMQWIRFHCRRQSFRRVSRKAPITVWEMLIDFLKCAICNAEGCGKLIWNRYLKFDRFFPLLAQSPLQASMKSADYFCGIFMLAVRDNHKNRSITESPQLCWRT